MTARPTRIAVLILSLLFCAAAAVRAQDAKNAVETIVVHGRIYTLDSKQPWAQALAVRAGKIIALGDDATIGKLRGPGTKIIDAAGQLVLPGFVDCHIHFLDGSLSLSRVNLEGAKDVADIQQRLARPRWLHFGP